MEPEPEIVAALYGELMAVPLWTFPKRREKLYAPARGGVYVLYNSQGRVVHVGRTTSERRGIDKRLRDHMANASSFTTKYLKGEGGRLRGRYKYRTLVVRNRRHRALLEAYATGQLCPAHVGLG